MNLIRRYWSDLALLGFITLNQVAISSILFISPSISPNFAVVSAALFILQILFAPLQASISDHYCRKTSLIFAWCGVVLSQTFFVMALHSGTLPLVISIVIFAALGNITPIARAALVDRARERRGLEVHARGIVRTPLALSTVAISLGWLITFELDRFVSSSMLFSVSSMLCVLSIPVTLFTLKDKQDKVFRWSYLSPKGELGNITRFLRVRWFLWGMLAYLLGEWGFYVVFEQVQSDLETFLADLIITDWVLAYCVGVVVTIASRISDGRAIGVGILLSLGAFVFAPFIPSRQEHLTWVSFLINSTIPFGYGLFVPGLLSWVSKNQKIHHQGVVFGIFESTDTLAQALTAGVLWAIAGRSWYLLYGLALGFLFLCGFCLIRVVRSRPQTIE